MSRDPTNRNEWREAVLAAEVMLRIDVARQYGIITGGPEVDVARCLEIIERGRATGYAATEAEIREALAASAADPGKETP